MESKTLDVGPAPRVKILTVRGDLRLSGREGRMLEAKAPRGSQLSVLATEDHVELTSLSDCLVFLPTGASVEIESVGGDLRATGLKGDLTADTVGGGLDLHRLGNLKVETIGGDAHVHKISGDLSIERIGGDALVDESEGSVHLGSVGGDVRLRRLSRSGEVRAGGDARVQLSPQPGSHWSIHAGGDLACDLPSQASVMVRVEAGGELRLSVPEAATTDEEGAVVRLGSGDAELHLSCGGDLRLRAGEAEGEETAEDIGEHIAAEVEARIAQMEARMQAVAGGVPGFDSERIGEHVRRAVERAQRHAEHARERAAKHHAGLQAALRLDVRGEGAQAGRSSAEEQLSILRMLEQGKITVEEAEQLLRALEGEV